MADSLQVNNQRLFLLNPEYADQIWKEKFEKSNESVSATD